MFILQNWRSLKIARPRRLPSFPNGRIGPDMKPLSTISTCPFFIHPLHITIMIFFLSIQFMNPQTPFFPHYLYVPLKFIQQTPIIVTSLRFYLFK